MYITNKQIKPIVLKIVLIDKKCKIIPMIRANFIHISALIIIFSALSFNAKAESDTLSNKIVNEVVVTGTRYETDIRHLPMTVSVVDRKTLETSNESSILPILNNHIPGLFSTSRGVLGYGVSTGASGQISLRGVGGPAQASLPTTGVLVLIDGHPQYMGLMGHPIADAYQTLTAERVEVLRGPASVLYGSNAMGGIINIVTRKNKEDGVFTHFNLSGGSFGTFIGEVSNIIRRGAFSSTVAANYSRTDGHRPNMPFEQYGGYAKLKYEMNNEWSIWGDLNVTHFNATNPGSITEPYIDNDQRITRGVANFAVQNNYKYTSGSISAFYNWGKHWINDGYRPGGTPLEYRFNSNDIMAGISIYQSAALFKGNRLTAGFDYFHFGGKAYNKYSSGDKSISADKKLNQYAGYIDFRQNIGTVVTIDAGLRIDHHSHSGTQYIPQAGVALHLPYQSEVKAMVSKGFRNPTIREMFMFPPQNPNLNPEEMWSYELSFNQRVANNKVNYGVNLYYIDGKNLIMRMPNPNGSGMLNQNSGKIENYGAELSVNYIINSHWNLTSNYSWLYMENPVLSSPEHKLFAGANFTKGKWSASTGIQYIKGLYTDLDNKKKEEYLLWDIQGEYQATKSLSLYVKGENILAQEYEVMAGYPMPKATFMGGLKLKLTKQ